MTDQENNSIYEANTVNIRTRRGSQMWKKIAIVAASAVVLTACAEPVKNSGFLSNYSQLTPDPKIEGAMAYRAPNLYS